MNAIDAMYEWLANITQSRVMDRFDINTVVRIVDAEYTGGVDAFVLFWNKVVPEHERWFWSYIMHTV